MKEEDKKDWREVNTAIQIKKDRRVNKANKFQRKKAGGEKGLLEVNTLIQMHQMSNNLITRSLNSNQRGIIVSMEKLVVGDAA